MIKGFNVRVYGICINSKNQVLLTDEFRIGMKMTKFVGGGLEFGEGIRECLAREVLEETSEKAVVGEHFYTTDFFQESISFNDYQLISIYYFFSFVNKPSFNISDKHFDFNELIDGAQSFRWVDINTLSTKDVTFPIDKIVVEKLKKKYSKNQ